MHVAAVQIWAPGPRSVSGCPLKPPASRAPTTARLPAGTDAGRRPAGQMGGLDTALQFQAVWVERSAAEAAQADARSAAWAGRQDVAKTLASCQAKLQSPRTTFDAFRNALLRISRACVRRRAARPAAVLGLATATAVPGSTASARSCAGAAARTVQAPVSRVASSITVSRRRPQGNAGVFSVALSAVEQGTSESSAPGALELPQSNPIIDLLALDHVEC